MESSNCLPKEKEVNVEGQTRYVEFKLGLTVDREVKLCSTLQKALETSTPSGPERENQHAFGTSEDGLANKYWDDSVARVTSQLKDKLGVRAGCCEKAVGKPNGYWLGPVNGENGFTKLDNHVWSGEKRDHHFSETKNACPDLENAVDCPGRSKVLSQREQLISSPSSITSLENFQGYDKSASFSETQSAGQGSNDGPASCERSSGVGFGPLSYSYVNLENSTSVAIIKAKPKVHIANLVTTSPAPSSSLQPSTSLCTYRNNVQCDADEIHYVAYESELQMPDIMRLIQKDLSEPYSIYTYRYFIHNWPKLCFLAMDGEKCVGAIVCKLDLHKNIVRRGYIAMLAVDENYRKRKIGSNLVLKAIQAMVTDDADEVVLETEISNKPALRLYENLGFVRDKRLFRYYLNGVDALRLKLWLR